MSSVERRLRERENTRRMICDAARALFVERGYDATTMRAIADRIDFTPTAIYHHFRNKEALLEEICVSDFRMLGEAFQRIGRVADPLERLRRIGAAYVDFALENPMQYRLMFMSARPDASEYDLNRDDPGRNAYAFLQAKCAEAIAAGSFAQRFQDPAEVARMLWSNAHGIVSLAITKQHEAWIDFGNVRETAAEMRAAMLRGMQER